MNKKDDKKKYHVCTVGASILKNYRIDENKTLPEISNDIAYKNIVTDKEKYSELLQKIEDWLDTDPRKASAEINAMWKFIETKSVDGVYLLGTDTNVGDICLKSLQRYFSKKGICDGTKQVKNFGTTKEYFQNGLIELGESIARISRRKIKQGYQILFNATGGWKPEAAIILFLGVIHGYTVYYRYETFHETIEIPPIPIIMDNTLFKEVSTIYNSESKSVSPQNFHNLDSDIQRRLLDLKIVIPVISADKTIRAYELSSLGLYIWEFHKRIRQNEELDV